MHFSFSSTKAILTKITAGLIISISFYGCKSSQKSATLLNTKFRQRVDFGQLLEPENRIIHGAGQSHEAFLNYEKVMEPNQGPLIYMTYASLKGIENESWRKKMETIRNHSNYVIPQIGLSMTTDGKPEERYEHMVAEGHYDRQIEYLANQLNEYGQPVYLRLAYEFNGFWNGYKPEPLKQAWERVYKKFRQVGCKNVAFVWTFAVDGDEDDFMKFYPGDSLVDWWGIDVFADKHFTAPETKVFMDSSFAHKKPVLIGECTPRRVSVQLGQESWDRWFAQFFKMMNDYPNLKGFSYINWDWSKTRWEDWGDGRIEANELIKRKYNTTLSDPIFLHTGSKGQVYKMLRFSPRN